MDIVNRGGGGVDKGRILSAVTELYFLNPKEACTPSSRKYISSLNCFKVFIGTAMFQGTS